MNNKNQIDAFDLDKPESPSMTMENLTDLGRAVAEICAEERIKKEKVEPKKAYEVIRGFYLQLLQYHLAIESANSRFKNKGKAQTLKQHLELDKENEK